MIGKPEVEKPSGDFIEGTSIAKDRVSHVTKEYQTEYAKHLEKYDGIFGAAKAENRLAGSVIRELESDLRDKYGYEKVRLLNSVARDWQSDPSNYGSYAVKMLDRELFNPKAVVRRSSHFKDEDWRREYRRVRKVLTKDIYLEQKAIVQSFAL